MALYEFEGRRPVVGAGSYIAETADVIGDVCIGEQCFVGPGARIKGDYGSIVIGDETSVQENCVVHARPEGECCIGSHCTIGHGAILHNCVLKNRVVIGMGAIISDWAIVHEGSLIGEGAVVRQAVEIPADRVAVGVPAQVTSATNEATRGFQRLAHEVYVQLAQRYRAGLKKL